MTEEDATENAKTRTKADNSGQDEPEEGDLPPQQEKALTALLTSGTVEAAAKKASVSARTLRRWLQEPEFRRAYLVARRQSLEQATGALQQATSGAVASLIQNLRCGNPGVEVRAAQIILEQAAKGVEMMEFEERLASIEESLAQTGDGGGR